MIRSIYFKTALLGSVALAMSSCKSIDIDCFGYTKKQTNLVSSASGFINISIDGSASMKGFATPKNSVYHRIIEELEPVLSVSSALGMPSTKTSIHRIGLAANPSPQHIKDKLNSLLIARSPDLYEPPEDSPWKNVSSSIAKFVSSDPGALDVLITDLEPDESSIKQLITAIKPKLTHDPNPRSWLIPQKANRIGNQLAVIGIRSEFDGGVFPTVSGTFPSFPYYGLRPFYILLLGPTDKSEIVIQRLERLNLSTDQLQISRFAANPGYGRSIFAEPSDISILPKNCYSSTFSIGSGLAGKLKFDSDKKWIKLVRGVNCTETNFQLTYNINAINGIGKLDSTDPNLWEMTNAYVTATRIANTNSSLSLKSSIAPGSIGLLQASIKADQIDALKWKPWNMDNTRPNGAKTQHIYRFIRNLRSETDMYSNQSYGSTYSPIRVCSALKG